MKKIFTSAFVILATATGFSQEVKWGVKGGLNYSNLRGIETTMTSDDGESIKFSSKGQVGFYIGGFAEYQISDKLAIQPELLISTQGGGREFKTSGTEYGDYYAVSVENKLNLTYLQIPVMLKYQVIDRLNIEFGPQIGFALSGKEKISIFSQDGSDVESGSFEFSIFKDEEHIIDGETIQTKGMGKRLDFGLNIGASYDITDNLFVQGRYNFGLASINKSHSINLFGGQIKNNELKNSVFQLGVGYKF